VNPEECIWWIDERVTEFAKLLSEQKLPFSRPLLNPADPLWDSELDGGYP
jgi:hypothetical protein